MPVESLVLLYGKYVRSIVRRDLLLFGITFDLPKETLQSFAIFEAYTVENNMVKDII